jgi:hypothetical protein
MPVPEFEIPAYPITDEGELLVHEGQLMSLVGDEPQKRTVFLGRKAKRPGRAALSIAQFLHSLAGTPPPPTMDYYTKAMRSVRLVYGNDSQGDCVIASGMHGLGCWSGNDSDSPGIIVGTTQEALADYHRIGGPGDNGLVITEALDDFTKTGLMCGGRSPGGSPSRRRRTW